MQFYCQNTIRPNKNILNYAYVLKNGVGRYNIFFYFYSKLAESSFLCRFPVESVNVLVCAMYFFSTNNFSHAQTLYRMRSLCRSYECMNIVRINIGFFTGFKKIKQRRISFFLGYLRMQHYVIKFVSDFRQIGGFLRVLQFPSQIKLTATI
jgi:hypothetical protein